VRFEIRYPNGEKHEVELQGTVAILGRDPSCDLVINDVKCSRRHAVMEAGPDGLAVRDSGSANGVFVNGRKTDRSPLKEGDEVKLGDVVLRVLPEEVIGTVVMAPDEYGGMSTAPPTTELPAVDPDGTIAPGVGFVPPPAPPLPHAAPPPPPIAAAPTAPDGVARRSGHPADAAGARRHAEGGAPTLPPPPPSVAAGAVRGAPLPAMAGTAAAVAAPASRPRAAVARPALRPAAHRDDPGRALGHQHPACTWCSAVARSSPDRGRHAFLMAAALPAADGRQRRHGLGPLDPEAVVAHGAGRHRRPGRLDLRLRRRVRSARSSTSCGPRRSRGSRAVRRRIRRRRCSRGSSARASCSVWSERSGSRSPWYFANAAQSIPVN
jgi:predicted component of type VI protein secretion system